MAKRKKREIVKIQIAQYPRGGDMLIYNEDQSIMTMLPEDPMMAELINPNTGKGYFFITLVPDKKVKNGVHIKIEGEAPWQDW